MDDENFHKCLKQAGQAVLNSMHEVMKQNSSITNSHLMTALAEIMCEMACRGKVPKDVFMSALGDQFDFIQECLNKSEK